MRESKDALIEELIELLAFDKALASVARKGLQKSSRVEVLKLVVRVRKLMKRLEDMAPEINRRNEEFFKQSDIWVEN